MRANLIINEARRKRAQVRAVHIFLIVTLVAVLALRLGPAKVAQAAAPASGSNCAYGQGHWKNHPEAWPVTSLTLGGTTYSQSQLLDILNTQPRGDATYILAHQLIATKLNVAKGADDSAVASTIADADNWLSAHELGSKPSGSDRSTGTGYAQVLDDYNNGLVGPGQCSEAGDSDDDGDQDGNDDGGQDGNDDGGQDGDDDGDQDGNDGDQDGNDGDQDGGDGGDSGDQDGNDGDQDGNDGDQDGNDGGDQDGNDGDQDGNDGDQDGNDDGDQDGNDGDQDGNDDSDQDGGDGGDQDGGDGDQDGNDGGDQDGGDGGDQDGGDGDQDGNDGGDNDNEPTDTASPTGGISVNGGAKESAHSEVVAQLWAIDNIGVTDMMLSIDASPTGTSWEPYTIKKELDLSDGLHTIYVKYRDAAGNESPVYSQQIVVTNRGLPARISINDGAVWTNTPNVSLELVGPLYTTSMKISNDGGLAGSTWEPYQLGRAWTLDVLPNQTATYAVYAIFQDAWGAASAVVNDTIVYDPVPPKGSVSLKNQLGEQNVGSSTLSLVLSAQDDANGSGVGQMRLSSSKDFSDGTGWLGYNPSYEWAGDDETVYVQFKDNAGNESEVYSLTIKGPQPFTVYLPIIIR